MSELRLIQIFITYLFAYTNHTGRNKMSTAWKINRIIFYSILILLLTIMEGFSQKKLPDFVPGELIIGYETEQAQKDASEKNQAF